MKAIGLAMLKEYEKSSLPSSIFEGRELMEFICCLWLFPSEVGGYVSPLPCLPLYYGRVDIVGAEPFLRPAYERVERFGALVAFKLCLALFLLDP